MQTWARSDSKAAFANPALVRHLRRARPPALAGSGMSVADDLDQAWDATGAAEELRRDAARGVFRQEDVNDGELARQGGGRLVSERPVVEGGRPASALCPPAPGLLCDAAEREGPVHGLWGDLQ